MSETWGKRVARDGLIVPANRPTIEAGVMRWTVRLEVRTDVGEVETTELATITRPAMAGTLEEVGLMLAEAKAPLATLQASMVRSQVAEHAAARWACTECGVPRPLKNRRTRRLQTLFGTVAVGAPWLRVCRCVPLGRFPLGRWCTRQTRGEMALNPKLLC